MGDQRRFASIAWSTKGKITRREQFLAEMDELIRWSRLLDAVDVALQPRPTSRRAGAGIPEPRPELPVRLQRNRHRLYYLSVVARQISNGVHHEYTVATFAA